MCVCLCVAAGTSWQTLRLVVRLYVCRSRDKLADLEVSCLYVCLCVAAGTSWQTLRLVVRLYVCMSVRRNRDKLADLEVSCLSVCMSQQGQAGRP